MHGNPTNPRIQGSPPPVLKFANGVENFTHGIMHQVQAIFRPVRITGTEYHQPCCIPSIQLIHGRKVLLRAQECQLLFVYFGPIFHSTRYNNGENLKKSLGFPFFKTRLKENSVIYMTNIPIQNENTAVACRHRCFLALLL